LVAARTVSTRIGLVEERPVRVLADTKGAIGGIHGVEGTMRKPSHAGGFTRKIVVEEVKVTGR